MPSKPISITQEIETPLETELTFPQGLSLRINFGWTMAGNVVYAGCQWGMLIVLAKLGTPEMVGQFALGLAICAPVFMFTNLQLRGVQATDARQEYEFGHYLGLRLITTILALSMIAGISLVGYNREIGLVILAVGMAKAFESVSDVFYGLQQQAERMDRIAISMIIKGPLSLTALFLGVYLSNGVLWGVIGLILAWMLVLISYDIPTGRMILGTIARSSHGPVARGVRGFWLLPIFSIKNLLSLAWLAFPLGFVMMLISLNANTPRYFIEHLMGDRELGIFAAMAYLMVTGTMVVGALGQSASPRLARYYVTKNKAFLSLLLKLVGVGVLLGCAGILVVVTAGREILSLLYRPEYAEHINVFFWLMVAAGISYIASFLGYGMTAVRYFRPQMPLFVLVVITSALACWRLVPSQGLRGAALAILISVIVQAIGSFAIIWHALGALSQQRGSAVETKKA